MLKDSHIREESKIFVNKRKQKIFLFITKALTAICRVCGLWSIAFAARRFGPSSGGHSQRSKTLCEVETAELSCTIISVEVQANPLFLFMYFFFIKTNQLAETINGIRSEWIAFGKCESLPLCLRVEGKVFNQYGSENLESEHRKWNKNRGLHFERI